MPEAAKRCWVLQVLVGKDALFGFDACPLVSVGSPVTALHVLELFATASPLVQNFFVLFGGFRSADSSCHMQSLAVFQSRRYELQCCYRCLCTNRRCDTPMPECFHTARRNAQVNFSNFSRMKRQGHFAAVFDKLSSWVSQVLKAGWTK